LREPVSIQIVSILISASGLRMLIFSPQRRIEGKGEDREYKHEGSKARRREVFSLQLLVVSQLLLLQLLGFS